MIRPEVLVVGGGVVGLTIAQTLSEAGAWVTVVDRQAFGREASWAGAGIIPPAGRTDAVHPLDRLKSLGARRYPGMVRRLEGDTGLPTGYRVNGGVELYHTGNDSRNRWLADGIAVEAVTLPDIEPTACWDGPAYRFPGMAQVRNPWLLQSLETSLRIRGVTLIPNAAGVRLIADGSRVVGAEWSNGRIGAGTTVVAAGAWSREMLAPLGIDLPVTPIRGQIIQYEAVESLRHTLIADSRYLVPRGDGTLLVGSNEQHAGFVNATTPEGIAELRAFAASILPDLAAVAPVRSWAGLRPGSADGLPTIGVPPDWRGLLIAAGHYRAGIQTAPATAELVRDLILGNPPTLDPAPYAPDRLPGDWGESAFRS